MADSEHLSIIFGAIFLTLAAMPSWAQCSIPAATSTPTYPPALIDEMTGQPLSSTTTKCIVLIHGWNPNGPHDDFYSQNNSIEFSSLIGSLKLKLKGSGWAVVKYHWEIDADTGLIGNPVQNGTFQFLVVHANEAAANAQLHGDHLATVLDNAAPDLREVQFIAHSAGTHAAKEAMIQMLQLNPYVIVQTTFLDPYIPCPADSLGNFSDYAMDELQFTTGNNRIQRLENYFANDDPNPIIGWNPYPWGIWTWPTINTSETFYWRSGIDINQEVDWGTRIIGTPSYTPNYDWHAGPIQFYADTVDASISGHTPSSSLPAGSPYDYRNIGWNRSLYAWEANFPQITIQPADQTVASGGSVTLSITVSGAVNIDWYAYGGSWVGSGSTLTLNNFTAANPRLYVAHVSNNNGQLYSRPALITVGAAATPTISSVSPTSIPTSASQQQIKIYGTGFTSSSTLLFNGVTESDPTRLNVVSANEIDYNVIVQSAGNWTVQVVNGSQQSNQGSFTVYTPAANTGSLVVNLSPAGATTAGAQWLMNGVYHNSGDVVASLTPGQYSVSFKSISGYTTPANFTVNIVANQQTTTNATYTAIAASTYTLTLNYNNTQGGASASPLTSGSIYTAGSLVQLYASASSGYHFTGWSGDLSGTNNPVNITMNGNKNITANFASGDPNMGTVIVTIQPPEAAAAGVKWGWNADDYRDSGTSVTTWPATYILTIHPVDGWLGPSALWATITAGQTTSYTVTFTQDTTPGLLTVTFSPPDAVTAGAKWHVNGGTAQGNGATVSLPPGTNYAVTFDSISGWTAPPNQTVQVQRAQTTIVSGNYTPPAGQPLIATVHPSFGELAGGTALTIEGVNFTAPITVLIGGKPATNVSVLSASQIVCLTPSSSVYGTVPVVVQTAGGSVTNLNGFAYGVERGNGIELVSAIGGEVNAVAVGSNYAYIGEGSSFVVADISNSTSPSVISRLALPGIVRDIALSGQYAYVANQDAGLQVVDISNPAAPKLVGFYATPSWADGVAILGSKAYVADETGGLQIFDIALPATPVLLSSTNLGEYAYDVAVSTNANGVFAYMVVGTKLVVVDVTNPLSPVVRSQLTVSSMGSGFSLATSGSRVFMAPYGSGVRMVDVSDPDHPIDQGQVANVTATSVAAANDLVYAAGPITFNVLSYASGSLSVVGYASVSSSGKNLAVSGNRCYLAGGPNGFLIVDVSNPAIPASLAQLAASSGDYTSAARSGNFLYATFGNGFGVFDISSPALPTLVGKYSGLSGWDIVVTNGIACFCGGGTETRIVNVSNPSAPALISTIPGTFVYAYKMVRAGNLLLIAGNLGFSHAGFALVDVGSPASPLTHSKLDFGPSSGTAWSVAVSGNKAVVGLDSGELKVLDISNIDAPVERGGLNIGGVPYDLKMSSDGRYTFVADTTGNSFRVVDVSNPVSPIQIANVPLASGANAVEVRDNLVYVATFKGVFVFDVTVPASPVLTRSYATPSAGYGLAIATNPTQDEDTVFVAASDGGLVVLRTKDTDQPQIWVTTPTALAVVTNTVGSLNFGGGAADNIALTKVTWSNNRGGGGDATGTTDWSVNGIALLPGTNILTATAFDQAGNNSNATLTVLYQSTNQNQSITFPAISDHTFGDPAITLDAAASSGLPVTFSVVSGPATLTSSNVLTLNSAGTVTVEADQSGNSGFNPATPVDLSFNVARANQSIAFAPVPNHSAGDAPFALTATTSSGLPVYFNVLSGPATSSSNLVTLLGGGSVVVVAWQPGNSNFNAAATVQQSFIVTKVPQTITFGALSPQKVGDAPFALNATASSGLPVSFSILTGPAQLSGNIVTLTNWGSVVIRASQPGNNLYIAASNVDQSLTVLPPDTNSPTIKIISPLANVRLSNAVVTVSGTATDNVQVASVWCSLNNGSWSYATGTTNWTNSLAFAPGTNVLQAYSMDTSGNCSVTNNVSFIGVFNTLLTVRTNGLGIITPSYNGQMLTIGQPYSMTATATNGFVFTNWTGGTDLLLALLTNGTTVRFLMVSNLTLQANFVDTNKPTVSITNLVGGQRVSNGVFTVKGKASDNWQLSNVVCQINYYGWYLATNINNWTNWSAGVTLVPGTNVVQAYAVDTTGNVSTTNSVSFDFVVTNQLHIHATGLGTVSPNYSNSWLEVGRNYSITSTPASGFVATNWVITTNWLGGVTNNGKAVHFMMQSNLTLQVNFLDVTRPTNTVTSPAAGQHMTNALATVVGTAKDNWKVAGVWYQLNSDPWNLVNTTNFYTNWTKTVTLLAGTNTLKAYAVDLAGNFSATNSLSVVSSNTFMLQLAFTNALPLKTNGLVFNLQLSKGLNGHIQVSTNLTSWTTLTNFVGTNTTLNFRDPAATNSIHRFYRAVIP